MLPIPFFSSGLMFIASTFYLPHGLADIDGLVIAWAIETINAFFFLLWRAGLVFATQHIKEFLTGCGTGIDACLAEGTFYLVKDIARQERYARKRFVLSFIRYVSVVEGEHFKEVFRDLRVGRFVAIRRLFIFVVGWF